MSHADPIAPLYDHEQEDALGGRRAAHDWGADDLFDGTRHPRRGRFVRAGVADDHDVELAAAVDDDPRLDRADDVRWFENADFGTGRGDDFAHGDAAGFGRGDDFGRDDDEVGGRRERSVVDWFADDERKRVDDWLAEGRSAQLTQEADAVGPDELPSPTAPTLELDLPLGATRPARRTVTITGHPDAIRRAERAGEIARRRPAPSLDARLAHRPDRVAMWACALGLLLVVVAIATAGT